MRVTDSIVYRQINTELSRKRSNLFSLQEQGTTGLKFQSIDEDPTSAERVRLLTESLEAAKHYEKNINRSRIPLEAGDSALEQSTELLKRAKELALAMSNDTVSASERAIVAGEVQSLYDTMLELANTKAGGEYVFSGFSTDTQPFLTDGTFVGDTGVKQVDVGPNSQLNVNLDGAQAFTAAGGIDIFAELDTLVTALQTNDVATVRNQLTAMDSGLNQVVEARTRAGLKLNQLDVASSVRDRIEDSVVAEKSQIIDIDPVKVFMDMQAESKSLEDALAVSQKVMSISIFG
ncbi:MAG: flagellar hook-associated protein FlgL [Deltaproteobacteria bacterium]|nr:flagellar hook-associated protein FlgL [Deltaproteobacteria bacterium]